MAFLKKRAGYAKRDFLIRSEYKHWVRGVSSKGHTVFRVFPSPLDQGFAPQIVPVDGDPMEGLSDSFAEVELAAWFGDEKITFISTCSDVDSSEYVSPALMLYNKVDEYCKQEAKNAASGKPFGAALPVWNPWFDKKGKISLPQTRMLLQGVLIEYAGKPCVNKDNAVVPMVPVVLYLGRSATRDMEDGLTAKLDVSSDISAENSVIGDITGVDTGCAIRIYSFKNKEGAIRYAVQPDFDIAADGRTRVVKPPVPLDPNMVLSHFVPWEQLLDIHDAAWQIDKLVGLFGPEAVDFAMGTDSMYGSMLPEGVAGSFAASPLAGMVTPQPMGQAQQPQAQPQYAAPAAQQPQAQPQYAAPAQTTAGAPQTAPVQTESQAPAPRPAQPVLRAEVVDAEVADSPAPQQQSTDTNSVVAIAMAAAAKAAGN